MLECDLRKTLQLHGAAHCIFSHALATIAFDQPLDGIEQIGPYGLRAEIAAPDSAADRIHQEERNGGNDQEAGEVVDLLRPQLDEEEIESAIGQIDEDGLARRTQTTVPSHERQQVVDAEAERHQAPFDAPKCSGDALRIDFLLGDIKRPISSSSKSIGSTVWFMGRLHLASLIERRLNPDAQLIHLKSDAGHGWFGSPPTYWPPPSE